MIGWNKKGNLRVLSNDRELLNHVVEVDKPHTNTSQLHVMRKIL